MTDKGLFKQTTSSERKRTDNTNKTQEIPHRKDLPPDLLRALETSPPKPLRFLWNTLRGDGALTFPVLFLGLLVGSGGVLLEALLFRGLFDLSTVLTLPWQRIGGTGMILALLLLLLLLELPLAALTHRLGRKLESSLLIAFMEKIPRLSDRYFQSRPVSDMAERSHTLHIIRNLPLYGGEIVRLIAQFVMTVLAILWIAPASAAIVIPGALLILALPFALEPFLAERDMRMRTHRGGLARFYLDSMIGAIPVHVHGAEESIRREHETLLKEWERAGFDLYRVIVPATAVQLILGTGLVILLLSTHLAREGATAGILLLSYWGLQLPLIGERIGAAIQRYPAYRSVTLRLLEPLGTPEATAQQSRSSHNQFAEVQNPPKGAAIAMHNVEVTAGGNTILEDINLTIDPGEHVAIIGHSGAGKSTLAGLLLGWQTASAGALHIDGATLTPERLERLRRSTVLVDPAVQLWNTSLFENLLYGNDPDAHSEMSTAISDADIESLLVGLPEGMMTQLGEGGSFLSGGEGQRVRLGRALLKNNPRLAILDEPFRGLDRQARKQRLNRVRAQWKDATLICITHDVEMTTDFSRVLVLHDGQLVEDGSPTELSLQPGSQYASLLEVAQKADVRVWNSDTWKRLWMENGKLSSRREAKQ